MLYIFLVDTGSMLTFDMNLALGSVASLKQAIATKCKIPEDRQVLLISGGESLNSGSRVCSYGAAGTDTSPIFLFSKNAIESQSAPTPMTDYGLDVDVKERVESCLNLEPSYNTVVTRTELAKQMNEMASQQLHICEKLVHDQHLQHQGWRAVVANLEDIVKTFASSLSQLEQTYSQFLLSKGSSRELLLNFKNDLDLLSRIPLLPGLVNSDNAVLQSSSLLDWINQKDCESNLESIAEKCLLALDRFDGNSLSDLKEQSHKVLENANSSDMQEIKGLEERLFGLDKLMAEAKKFTAEQTDLSGAIYQNQQRASNLRDVSIFPDLCKSHQTQLQHMLKNHQQLRDIRRRCMQAKKELSSNIHSRLRWIMFVEKKLADLDSKVLIYRETIRRLRRHLEMIEQVHVAPQIYMSAVVEVVRRKKFSGTFLQWATKLAQFSAHVYLKENGMREAFNTETLSHFVSTLFPGLEDRLPSFACDSPEPFDLFLPSLTDCEISYLRELIPELTDLLHTPDEEFLKLVADFSKELLHCSQSDDDVSMRKVSLELTSHEDEEEEKIDKSTQSPSQAGEATLLVESLSIENLKSDASTFTSLQLREAEELEAKLCELESQLAEKDEELLKEKTYSSESDDKLQSQKSFLLKLCNLIRKSLAGQRAECEAFRQSHEQLKSIMSNLLDEAKLAFTAKLIEQQDIISQCNDRLEVVSKRERDQNKKASSVIDTLNLSVDELKSKVTEYEKHVAELKRDHEEKLDKVRIESEEAVRKVNLERELELEDEIKKVSLQFEDTIQTTESDLKNKDNRIKALQEERKAIESDLLLRYQQEKELVTQALHDKATKEKQQIRLDFSIQMKETSDRMEREKNALIASFDDEKKKALQELRDKLTVDHKNEMESLRYRFRMVQSTQAIGLERSSENLSVTPEERATVNMQHRIGALHQELDEMKQKHQAAIEKMKSNQQEEIRKLRASFVADSKEFSSNEAIKEYQVRETKIKFALSNLRVELEKEAPQLSQLLSSVFTCLGDRSSPEVISADELTQSFSGRANEYERRLTLLQNQLEAKDKMLEDLRSSASIPDALSDSQLNDLQIQLREKELVVEQLQQQLLVSPGSVGSPDKISVLSCDVGDVILLCFTERYNSYVVFSLNPVLHFLHNDSEGVLQLQPGPGEQRKSWALAEITDKEYCQARRPQNRYRVGAGTRFYRIKARPWTHPMVESRRMSASMITTPSMSAREGGGSLFGSPPGGADAPLMTGPPMSTSCYPTMGRPASDGST
ncbi:RB1-inducible coiled-coil protein 1 [Halotydeus destructor]|nr:RB1-inducible coiled-coil protein 1 [Halotydeus destructor]